MKTRTGLVTILLALAACKTSKSPIDGPGKHASNELGRLEALLSEHDFTMLVPPRADRSPGTILDTEQQGDVPVGTMKAESSLSPALFLRNWSAPSVSVDDASLFAVLGKVGFSTEMKRQGVSHYSWTFGDCAIASVTLDELQQAIPSLSAYAQTRLEGGCPVVIEALMVRSVQIGFLGGEKTKAGGRLDLILDDLSFGGSVDRTEAGQYTIQSDLPVYLGIRTRQLILDESVNVLVDAPRIVNRDHEPNDAKGVASYVDLPSTVSGRVGSPDDAEDWFALRPDENGELTLHIANTNAKKTQNGGMGPARFYGPNFENRMFVDLGPGQQTKKEKQFQVTAGSTYFVRIAPKPGHTVAYRIDFRFRSQ